MSTAQVFVFTFIALVALQVAVLAAWNRYRARRAASADTSAREDRANRYGYSIGVIDGYAAGFARGLVVGARADVDGNPGRVTTHRGQA